MGFRFIFQMTRFVRKLGRWCLDIEAAGHESDLWIIHLIIVLNWIQCFTVRLIGVWTNRWKPEPTVGWISLRAFKSRQVEWWIIWSPSSFQADTSFVHAGSIFHFDSDVCAFMMKNQRWSRRMTLFSKCVFCLIYVEILKARSRRFQKTENGGWRRKERFVMIEWRLSYDGRVFPPGKWRPNSI